MSDERYDEHYISSVTALGDTHEVVTHQAIFTRNGIKLIDRGTRINSALRDKLVQHKLMPAIDECLTIADGVTPASLRDRARKILNSEPRFALIDRALSGADRLLDAISAMPMNETLAFKLTVAREQRPDIYEHSIQITLFALYLAIKSHVPERDLGTVAAAAMLHDIGVLHIDPVLLQPGHRLDADELRHVYAHPMTAYLILQTFPPFHPEISTAVFEHHERLDGSGYPRGLKGEEISRLGQILMLAEAVTTLFEKTWHTHGASRLSVMLKMNRRKFNRELIGHLVSLLQHGTPPETKDHGEASATEVVAQLTPLAEVFRLWRLAFQTCTLESPASAGSPLVIFVNQRLTDLERTLLETGFHPDELAALAAGIQDDPEALAEVQLMACESRRQLTDILNEVRRRWTALQADDAGRVIVENWGRRSEAFLKA